MLRAHEEVPDRFGSTTLVDVPDDHDQCALAGRRRWSFLYAPVLGFGTHAANLVYVFGKSSTWNDAVEQWDYCWYSDASRLV